MNMYKLPAVFALLSCAAPLHAQTIGGAASPAGLANPITMGGFVGTRVRIPLGGAKDSDKRVRASLTVAPIQHREGDQLRSPTWRIGEGLDFGFTSDRVAPHVSLAGRSLTPARYAPGRDAAHAGRSNLSDGGTAAAVVVGLVVLVGGGLLLALAEAGDPDSCTPGECDNN